MKTNSDKPFERKAFIEITVTYHPEVLKESFRKLGGLRAWLLRGVFTVIWLLVGVTVQQSLAVHFSELPLYPLPVVIAFLAQARSAKTALASAILGGIATDALQFSRLGPTSAILGVCTLAIIAMNEYEHNFSKQILSRTVLAGGLSVAIYVMLKLVIFWSSGGANSGVTLIKHLFGGVALGAFMLAPIQFGIMDGFEWLSRMKRADE